MNNQIYDIMENQNLPTYQFSFEGYWREINKAFIPKKSGIYIVYRAVYNAISNTVDPKEIIYIGQAGKGGKRVEDHEKLPKFVECLKEGEELCYTFAEVEEKDLDIVENALVYMQKPIVNDYLKDSYNHEDAIFYVKGITSCLKSTVFSLTHN